MGRTNRYREYNTTIYPTTEPLPEYQSPEAQRIESNRTFATTERGCIISWMLSHGITQDSPIQWSNHLVTIEMIVTNEGLQGRMWRTWDNELVYARKDTFIIDGVKKHYTDICIDYAEHLLRTGK